MTDWDIVINGRAVASDVLNSTNDLIVPGNKYQYNILLEGIENGSVDSRKLQESDTKILNLSRKVSK